MGRKRLNPLRALLVTLSVTVCLAVTGCGKSHRAPAGQAMPASANLPATNSLSMSDAMSDASDTALSEPFGSSALEAVVVPPVGWSPDPLKRTRNHAHQAW